MTQLPHPQNNENLRAYLERLGYYWVDLWTIDDVLSLHKDFDSDKSDDENHYITGISQEQAIDTLKYAQHCNDASGDGLSGYPMLEFCLDHVRSKS